MLVTSVAKLPGQEKHWQPIKTPFIRLCCRTKDSLRNHKFRQHRNNKPFITGLDTAWDCILAQTTKICCDQSYSLHCWLLLVKLYWNVTDLLWYKQARKARRCDSYISKSETLNNSLTDRGRCKEMLSHLKTSRQSKRHEISLLSLSSLESCSTWQICSPQTLNMWIGNIWLQNGGLQWMETRSPCGTYLWLWCAPKYSIGADWKMFPARPENHPFNKNYQIIR